MSTQSNRYSPASYEREPVVPTSLDAFNIPGGIPLEGEGIAVRPIVDSDPEKASRPAIQGNSDLVRPSMPGPKDPKSVQGKSPKRLLIDFNKIHPDGSIGSLHAMLANLSHLTSADFYAGVYDNYSWVYASSQSQNHRGNTPSTELRGSIAEATSELSAFLFASTERQSSLLLQSVRQDLEVEHTISFGIEAKSATVGLVLAISTSSPNLDQLSLFIKQVRSELAEWIEVWYLCYQGARSHSWYARFRKLYYNRKKWLMVGCVALCSLAVPVPYWPQRQCIVEPASRRFLTSPINGRVIEAQVRPGDVVEKNQLLARIDDESVRWELANAEADYQKACKKRDTALATRSSGDLRMAQLESEQYAIQIESLQSKLHQLEIRSPIAGVVVEGDWVPTSGTAVERSQTLFEIAPLDTMRVRTLLSTEDLGQVPGGTPVTIRVDSAYGKKWSGAIERIDPRGRVENSEVVFEAETIVENPDHALRPGMRGSSRLTSGWHSLCWMICHRPYTWLMKKLVW